MSISYEFGLGNKKKGRIYSSYQKKAKLANLNFSPKIVQKDGIFYLSSRIKTVTSIADIRSNRDRINKKRTVTSFSMKNNRSQTEWNVNQQIKESKLILKQFRKLNTLQPKDLIDDQFDIQCEQAQTYAKFKNNLSSRNQIIFLKPHFKQLTLHYKHIKPKTPMQMKSTLYKQINQSYSTQSQNVYQNKTIIQYSLQYNPNPQKPDLQATKTIPHTRKRIGSNVLKQKLRKYYSVGGQYSERMRKNKDTRKFQTKFSQNLANNLKFYQ